MILKKMVKAHLSSAMAILMKDTGKMTNNMDLAGIHGKQEMFSLAGTIKMTKKASASIYGKMEVNL